MCFFRPKAAHIAEPVYRNESVMYTIACQVENARWRRRPLMIFGERALG